jgi:hypothetical protein
LIYNVKGHIKFVFNVTAGYNTVLSGIFFGGTSGTVTSTVATPVITPNGGTYSTAQSVTITDGTSGAEIRYTLNGTDPISTSALYSGPFTVSSSATVKAKGFKSGMNASAPASATFTISTGSIGGAPFADAGADTTTIGNWRGKYGADGYNVIGKAVLYPAYAQVVASSSKQDWIWNDPTSDSRALTTPDGSSRVAGCWYSSTGFDIDLNFTDGKTHRLAAYFLDWDYAGRSEKLELLDATTGTVLQTLNLSGFSGGVYHIWDLKGHLKLRVTKVAGPNAVVNGLFFQPSPTQL